MHHNLQCEIHLYFIFSFCVYSYTQKHILYVMNWYNTLGSALSICPWRETGAQVCCHLVKRLVNVYWCWWFLISFCFCKMQYCTCYLLSELGFKIRYQTNKYFKWVCVSNMLSQIIFIFLTKALYMKNNELVSTKHWSKVILQCIFYLESTFDKWSNLSN